MGLIHMERISLLPMTEEDTGSIWSFGMTDPFWPEPTRTLSGFRELVASFEAQEVIGWGSIRSVSMRNTSGARLECDIKSKDGTGWLDEIRNVSDPSIGFVTFHQLDETFVPSGTVVIECGTYLCPGYRGQGLNLLIKKASVTRALQELGADVVIYAVPVHNRPAIRSLERIFHPVGASRNQLSGTRGVARNPQFLQKWLHYREWKEGTSFVLYPFSLETAKSCDLLDPDGDDGHLAGKQKKPHDNE